MHPYVFCVFSKISKNTSTTMILILGIYGNFLSKEQCFCCHALVRYSIKRNILEFIFIFFAKYWSISLSFILSLPTLTFTVFPKLFSASTLQLCLLVEIATKRPNQLSLIWYATLKILMHFSWQKKQNLMHFNKIFLEVLLDWT